MGGDTGGSREGRGRGTAPGIGRIMDTDTGWVWVRGVGRLIDDQGHPIQPQSLIYESQNERRIFMLHLFHYTHQPRSTRVTPSIFLIIIEEMGGPPLVLMHVTHVNVTIPPRFREGARPSASDTVSDAPFSRSVRILGIPVVRLSSSGPFEVLG